MQKRNNIVKAIALMVISFAGGYVMNSVLQSSSKGFAPNNFEHFETDSVFIIKQQADSLLHIREKEKFDSIKLVAGVRDSLILVKGKIGVAQLTFSPNTLQYKQLDSLYFTVTEMSLLLDQVIMEEILDLLKPTNQQFTTLVKDINAAKEKLEKITGQFAVIGNIVQTLINIISSPIFPPAAAASPTTYLNSKKDDRISASVSSSNINLDMRASANNEYKDAIYNIT